DSGASSGRRRVIDLCNGAEDGGPYRSDTSAFAHFCDDIGIGKAFGRSTERYDQARALSSLDERGHCWPCVAPSGEWNLQWGVGVFRLRIRQDCGPKKRGSNVNKL